MTKHTQTDHHAVASDYAEERGWTLSESSIAEQLRQANGRRRTRTLDMEDIRDAADGLGDDTPLVLIDAGRVANAYKYRAVTTSAIVWRMGPFVMATVREVTAKGGTGFGDLIRKNGDNYKILDMQSLASCSDVL